MDENQVHILHEEVEQQLEKINELENKLIDIQREMDNLKIPSTKLTSFMPMIFSGISIILMIRYLSITFA